MVWSGLWRASRCGSWFRPVYGPPVPPSESEALTGKVAALAGVAGIHPSGGPAGSAAQVTHLASRAGLGQSSGLPFRSPHADPVRARREGTQRSPGGGPSGPQVKLSAPHAAWPRPRRQPRPGPYPARPAGESVQPRPRVGPAHIPAQSTSPSVPPPPLVWAPPQPPAAPPVLPQQRPDSGSSRTPALGGPRGVALVQTTLSTRAGCTSGAGHGQRKYVTARGHGGARRLLLAPRGGILAADLGLGRGVLARPVGSRHLVGGGVPQTVNVLGWAGGQGPGEPGGGARRAGRRSGGASRSPRLSGPPAWGREPPGRAGCRSAQAGGACHRMRALPGVRGAPESDVRMVRFL